MDWISFAFDAQTAPMNKPAAPAEPAANLSATISSIVKSQRRKWGGAPGGYVLGRLRHLEQLLHNYTRSHFEKHGQLPDQEQLRRIATSIARWPNRRLV